MNEFLNLYKKGGASYERLAFDYLVGDLLIKDRRGGDKAREITALDMESKAPIDFVPGMIYTFLYITGDRMEDSNGVNGKKFKDNVPVILCFAGDSKSVSGLNFNLIPTDVRASILDIVVKLTKTPMYNDNGEFQVNETIAKLFSLQSGVTSFLKYISKETGLNVSSAVRKYNVANIKKLRMIEYDMWKYIPFLNFKDAIRGAGLADLQADMIKDNR